MVWLHVATLLTLYIIIGLASGRGANLSDDTGFIDRRYSSNEEILLLRPMREFSDEEIYFYNKFSLREDIKFDDIQKIAWDSDSDTRDSLFSIQTLTRDFLVGLQENFPATIPTIFRTGDKLQRNQDNKANKKADEFDRADEICVLCRGQRDAFGATLEATNFSRLVSSKGKVGFESKVDLSPESIKAMNINNPNNEKKGKFTVFCIVCYSCLGGAQESS